MFRWQNAQVEDSPRSVDAAPVTATPRTSNDRSKGPEVFLPLGGQTWRPSAHLDTAAAESLATFAAAVGRRLEPRDVDAELLPDLFVKENCFKGRHFAQRGVRLSGFIYLVGHRVYLDGLVQVVVV